MNLKRFALFATCAFALLCGGVIRRTGEQQQLRADYLGGIVRAQQQNFPGGGGSPAASVKLIYPTDAQYGVKADVLPYYDASWTNGANPAVITISATDPPFSSSLSGKSCYGNANSGANNVPVGTFTFTDATHGTCSTTAGATATNTGQFVVCTNDEVAWEAVTTALYNSSGPAGVVAPNGGSCVTKGQLLDKRTAPIPWQPTMFSEGFFQWFPMPTFDFTTCNGASGNGGCFWDVNQSGMNQAALPQYSNLMNVGVNGMSGNCALSNPTGKSAFYIWRVAGQNIWVWNWCTNASAGTAITLKPPASIWNLQVNNSGSVGIIVPGTGGNNAMAYLTNSYVGESGTSGSQGITIGTGSWLISKGDYWLGCVTQCIIVAAGGFMTMDGDQINGASGNQFVDIFGTLWVYGNTQAVATNNSGSTFLTRSGGKIFIRDSLVSETGTSGVAFNINTVTGGSVINQGNVTLSAGTDQTVLVAANVVLSAGWGTTATVTALSGSPLSNPTRFQFQANSSGTGQAANPTIAITYPGTGGTFTTPVWTCKQSGGTQTIAQISGENTATTTTMTLTYNGTPVAGNNVVVTCTGSLL